MDLSDVAGSTRPGKIVGHVKDFLIHIIDFYSPTAFRRRELELEDKELDIESKRIKNAMEFVALAKDLGYDPSQVRQVAHWVDDRQESFAKLAASGKLTGVEILELEKPSENR